MAVKQSGACGKSCQKRKLTWGREFGKFLFGYSCSFLAKHVCDMQNISREPLMELGSFSIMIFVLKSFMLVIGRLATFLCMKGYNCLRCSYDLV